jgi:hypothetical protein
MKTPVHSPAPDASPKDDPRTTALEVKRLREVLAAALEAQRFREVRADALEAERVRKVRFATLAQIAAPFAAAGLADADAITRAQGLLWLAERDLYEEDSLKREENEMRPSFTKREAMERLGLTTLKRFKEYAKLIGKADEMKKAGPKEQVFSEHDIFTMIQVRKNRRKDRRKANARQQESPGARQRKNLAREI